MQSLNRFEWVECVCVFLFYNVFTLPFFLLRNNDGIMHTNTHFRLIAERCIVGRTRDILFTKIVRIFLFLIFLTESSLSLNRIDFDELA